MTIKKDSKVTRNVKKINTLFKNYNWWCPILYTM